MDEQTAWFGRTFIVENQVSYLRAFTAMHLRRLLLPTGDTQSLALYPGRSLSLIEAFMTPVVLDSRMRFPSPDLPMSETRYCGTRVSTLHFATTRLRTTSALNRLTL